MAVTVKLNGTAQPLLTSNVTYTLPSYNFSVDGSGIICSSEAYTVSGLPAGATVSWQAASSRGLTVNQLVSGNGITISRTDNTTGTVTLTATVTTACGTYTVQRTVYVGPVPAIIAGPYDPVQNTIMGVACVGEQYYFLTGTSELGSTFTWTLFPPQGSQDNPTLHSGSTVYLTFAEVGCYTLQVAKTNSCGGTVVTQTVICAQQCVEGFSVMASPNPATDAAVVTITDESEEMKSLSKNETIRMELVQLNTGSLQKSWTFKNDRHQFSLNLGGVNKGWYLLKVRKGKSQKTCKILL